MTNILCCELQILTENTQEQSSMYSHQGIRDVPKEGSENIVFVLNMRTHPTIGILSSTHALQDSLVEP